MIDLPLAALLAGARPNFEFFFELISYKSPLLCAILFYEFYDGVILLNIAIRQTQIDALESNESTIKFEVFSEAILNLWMQPKRTRLIAC